jgi:hypothetical protein
LYEEDKKYFISSPAGNSFGCVIWLNHKLVDAAFTLGLVFISMVFDAFGVVGIFGKNGLLFTRIQKNKSLGFIICFPVWHNILASFRRLDVVVVFGFDSECDFIGHEFLASSRSKNRFVFRWETSPPI